MPALIRRGSAAKNIVLVVVALAALGAATAIYMNKQAASAAIEAEEQLVAKAQETQLLIGRKLSIDPRFNRINCAAQPGPVIEITGTVDNQKDLDAAKALIEQHRGDIKVDVQINIATGGAK